MLANLMLYIVRFLHQTTTSLSILTFSLLLYIVRFLHQTTTYQNIYIMTKKLYIVRFLHQTTTIIQRIDAINMLYIVRFLHQTTTVSPCTLNLRWLYIVRFLHQTTTKFKVITIIMCCISSVSYIKPQPIITNKLYTNMLLIFFIIKNGRVGFVSIAKILKKLQLNRFADDFFCDFA